MTAVKRSEDQGFLFYQTSCAIIAALAGLNVGWHISALLYPFINWIFLYSHHEAT
jgi:hypothetical protein